LITLGIIFPFILLIIGTYLLWRSTQGRKHIVIGMVISALCLFLMVWSLVGYSQPSGFDCPDEFKVPPSYTCPQ
jgi:multisubunit Na+/H+ antiporter MnhC subunit